MAHDESLDLDSLRREALRAMARILRATDAKPDTLLRAAEAIMRAEPIAATQGARRSALSDQDLLSIAQGVHPPKMGPTVPSADSVPSDAPTVDPPGLVVPRETPSSDAVKAAFLSAAAETAAERPKGTQRGPVSTGTPGGPTSISQIAKRGPKTDPPIAAPAPQVASQIKIDDTPMPWE
jgi:hypothetical protein